MYVAPISVNNVQSLVQASIKHFWTDQKKRLRLTGAYYGVQVFVYDIVAFAALFKLKKDP